MARFKDEAVQEVLKAQLEPGEELKHWAYGVKQPNVLLIFGLYLLAILPGVIAVALLTKEYVVGLTNRRFIVLRVNGSLKVQEVLEYSLASLPPVKASTGALFTHIRIDDPQKPFIAKFHRLGMPKNREHTMAMEAVLSKKQLSA